MQRAVRILRLALPLLFIAFIVFIGLSWRKRNIRRDSGETQQVVTTRTGETPEIELKGFEDTQTIAGRVVSRIRAARVVAYNSGWNTLEDVQMTIFRENGLTYELRCPTAQFHTKTKEADAKGGVKVTSSDGIEIATAEIRFDGSRLTNDIPVQFRIDRWTGNGGALDLDVQGETLKLFKKVTATMTPTLPTESPMTLAGDEAIFRRKENDVAFTQRVTMRRLADSLAADRIVGRFSQDRKTLVGLEGIGAVDIVLASTDGGPMQHNTGGGRKHITCDRFYSELGGDGQISAINAVGESQYAHAVLSGPPARDIVAKNFRFAIAHKRVSEMKADWDVVMKELGEVTREVRADHVTVHFNPMTNKASSAFLDGNFKYIDPKNSAAAIRANYDIDADKIILTADPGFNPTVVSEGNTLKAKQIEFSPKAGTARAAGDVIAQLASKGGGAAADATNVFPAGKPVFVNADSLFMRNSNKTAVFTGRVRAWQETNTLLAQELQVQGAGDMITARGDVKTVLYNATGERKGPMTSRSDQLTARKNDRRMEMNGKVLIQDEQGQVNAEKATFFLDAARKIERVEADQKVVVLEKPTGRKVAGDKVKYLVNQKMAYVFGNPAAVTDPKGSNFSGQQIAVDLARNRVEVVSTTAPTQGVYKQ